jgi:hypothetical protein
MIEPKDLEAARSRLEVIKVMAAIHHDEMLDLQDEGKKDTPEYIMHITAFNALSSAIGLVNSIGKWKKFEAKPNRWRGISPLQSNVLNAHSGMVKTAGRPMERGRANGEDRENKGEALT